MKILSGRSNLELSRKVVEFLGVSLGNLEIADFSDGELNVRLRENVRGQDVYIIQTTSTPAANNLMEIFLMADTVKRSGAKKVIAVIPYLAYSRQDRRFEQSPISSKVVADLLEVSGVDHVITLDLHSPQIMGSYNNKGFHNIYASSVLVQKIKSLGLENLMVVSPDAGGVVRARSVAKKLDCGLAIIDKRRERANQSEVKHLIGDVTGMDCIIVDDMIDTAGTVCNAANFLKESGAFSVNVFTTHGVLSGPAFDRINESKINKVFLTDTIKQPTRMIESPRFEILSIAQILADTISKIESNYEIVPQY